MNKMSREKQDFKVIGTRVKRPDGIDKVTGRAQYGADLVVPGMLTGAVLRSPHAHAKINATRLPRSQPRTPRPPRRRSS